MGSGVGSPPEPPGRPAYLLDFGVLWWMWFGSGVVLLCLRFLYCASDAVSMLAYPSTWMIAVYGGR